MGPADRKNRYDHRHHAIDAVVIALTTRKHIHNLCTAYARTERGDRPDMAPPEPWSDRDSFRREVQQVMEEVGEGKELGISYRPTRMAERRRAKSRKGPRGMQVVTRGSLHEEHGLGPVWTDKKAGQRKEDRYVRRKSIGELTPAILNGKGDEIRNPEIRDLLRAECIRRGLAHRVQEGAKKGWTLEKKHFRLIRRALAYWHECEGEAASPWQPDEERYCVDADKTKLKNGLTKPFPVLPCRKSKDGGVPIKRVRITTVEKTAVPIRKIGDETVKYVKPGGNHHLEIYQTPDGKWTGRCVSRLKACERLRRGEAVVDAAEQRGKPDVPDGSKFLMSLAINDMVQLTDPETGEINLYRVQMTSHNPDLDKPDITFRLHWAAQIDEKATAVRSASWSACKKRLPHKVTVDPIGRIFPCHD
jgi:CRISPR-associated endonuclease Csn1